MIDFSRTIERGKAKSQLVRLGKTLPFLKSNDYSANTSNYSSYTSKEPGVKLPLCLLRRALVVPASRKRFATKRANCILIRKAPLEAGLNCFFKEVSCFDYFSGIFSGTKKVLVPSLTASRIAPFSAPFSTAS